MPASFEVVLNAATGGRAEVNLEGVGFLRFDGVDHFVVP